MVSTVTTLTDNSTQVATLLLAQAEASGPAWEQEGCWDISLVVREASPTTLTTRLTLTADVLVLETLPLPPGHALLQVLEEPREDRSCGWGQIMDGTENNGELGVDWWKVKHDNCTLRRPSLYAETNLSNNIVTLLLSSPFLWRAHFDVSY